MQTQIKYPSTARAAKLLDAQIDQVANRLDELFDGMEICTDPILMDGLCRQIESLSDELTRLCAERSKL